MSDPADPFITRVTINPINHGELFQEVKQIPKGYKARRIIELASFGLAVQRQGLLKGNVIAPTQGHQTQESVMPNASQTGEVAECVTPRFLDKNN